MSVENRWNFPTNFYTIGHGEIVRFTASKTWYYQNRTTRIRKAKPGIFFAGDHHYFTAKAKLPFVHPNKWTEAYQEKYDAALKYAEFKLVKKLHRVAERFRAKAPYVHFAMRNVWWTPLDSNELMIQMSSSVFATPNPVRTPGHWHVGVAHEWTTLYQKHFEVR